MTPITKPGIYEMTPAQYHADPCAVPSLSASIAALLVNRSPAHAYNAHPRFGGAVEEEEEVDADAAKGGTPEQAKGTLIHRLLLGKGAEIEVVQADSWRTNLAKASRARILMEGKIPTLPHLLAAAELAVASGRKQLDAMGLEHVFRDGRKEAVLVWEEDGIWLRAMVDNLIINEEAKRASLWDLKTVGRSSHPKACGSQMENMGYDLSLTFHARGLAALRPDLAGRIAKRWAFMEVKPPYSVTPCEITGEWETIAEHNTERAIARWRKCTTEINWPHYTNDVVRLEPRPFLVNELLNSTSNE